MIYGVLHFKRGGEGEGIVPYSRNIIGGGRERMAVNTSDGNRVTPAPPMSRIARSNEASHAVFFVNVFLAGVLPRVHPLHGVTGVW